jgi:hypothetical protein
LHGLTAERSRGVLHQPLAAELRCSGPKADARLDRRRQGGVQEEQTVRQTEEMIPENKALTVRPSTVDGELLRSHQ